MQERPGRRHVYYSYSPSYDAEQLGGLRRSLFVKALRAEGVLIAESMVGTPLHLTDRFQQRRGYVGAGLPWSAAPREVAYRLGDCPVAEDRCANTDLNLYLGANLNEPAAEYLDQIVHAFRKVTAASALLVSYQQSSAEVRCSTA